MEVNFKPPKNLVFDRNVHLNLETFLRSFEIYLKATGLEEKPNETKVAILLNIAGDEAQKKFLTFNLTEEQRKSYVEVVQAFKNYCKPMKNETYDRYKFFTRTQQEGETFEHFLTEIKMLASECNFETLEKSLIRDKIVSGISDLSLQERLLQISCLTSQRAEDLCRAAEISKLHIKDIRNDKEVSVIKAQQKKSNNDQEYQCLKCGYKHKKKNCPAFGKQCVKCKKFNHFAVGCRSDQARSSRNTVLKKKQNVHEVNSASESDSESLVYIDIIDMNLDQDFKNNNWTTSVLINNIELKFKLDTGATCNCLPYKIYEELGFKKEDIKADGVSIVTYSNDKIKTLGSVVLKCNINGLDGNVKFVIVEQASAPILGLNACKKLNLLQKVDNVSVSDKNSLINNNKTVFEGTGKIPYHYKIVLKKDATPFVSSCRRVPETVKPKLKLALDSLEKNGIICKMEQPTEWVNNIVLVEKTDGKIRICLDPVHLNENICSDQFPIPTLDDLSVKLKGKSIYTVLDLKEGFYHVPLDEQSIKYCTFITPFGKYAFKRLPFGLKVSPEVFQRVNEKMFADLDIGIYFDDYIIAAENEMEHDRILQEVLDRAKKLNIKFNKNKIQFKVREVKYLGQIFSEEGIKPDPEYIQAILKLENPKNKKELLRIIGMFNYLTKYIPNLSELFSPLRSLIKNNTPWNWTGDHTNILNNIKELITKIPNLQIFDSQSPIEIQTDASDLGVGACLLQNGKPVAFCSRSLTETETRYPIIDKEMLGICFALKKFHNFVYGRKISIKTDHAPLVAICNKDFYKVSPRLQKLKLKTLQYNFDIQHLPGKFMFIADLLSRSFLKKQDKDDFESIKTVHCADIELPISDATLTELKNATKNDSILMQVKQFCINGWPKNKRQLLVPELNTYFKIKDELSVKNQLIFYKNKLVIPKMLRKKMLKKLHTGHFGIEKSKARARKIFYWPNLSSDVQKFVSSCEVCLKFSKKPVKEPLIQHDRPCIPFIKIASDILTFGGYDYLVVVDYHSNWIDLIKLESKTAHEIIQKLKSIFATHGIPKTFISDNMPFNSVEFKQFAKDWDFNIVTSSPRYPKSNGLAERSVGICKNILRKCQEDNTDYHKALLEYRNTPLTNLDVSPAELLSNRLLRTSLPVSSNILINKQHNSNKLLRKRVKAKMYYDRQAKLRNDFNPGDSIIIRKERYWVPGEIVRKCKEPRSYIVRDNYGKTFRRNSSFLKLSPNPITSPLSEHFDDMNNVSLPVGEPIMSKPIENKQSTVTVEPGPSNVLISKPTNNIQTRSGRIIHKPIRYR